MTAGTGARATRHAERVGQAILWALAGTLAASMVLATSKLAGSDAHPVQMTFIRYVTGLLITIPIYLAHVRRVRRRAVGDEPEGPAMLALNALRALVAVARLTCFFYAVAEIPLANAQSIIMTNGIFVILFAIMLLGEKVDMRVAAFGMLCIVGGVLAAEPDFSTPGGWVSVGAIYAFAGAALFGLESVLIKYTAERDSAPRILFIVNLAAMLYLVLPAWFLWQDLPLWLLATLLLLGPFALSTQFFNLMAFRYAKASVIAPFRYTSMIFAILIGILAFNEWPSGQALAGMALIAAGGIAVALITTSRRKASAALPSGPAVP